ncbi:hypothetical protein [Arthrobacter sp. GMC3]|uniref:hypothetical protein n=1 Tax=Arthrobacter sp. GMC3 TaxID=2058894 RepID=UPI000CE53E3C|nr:hypothetical protein [Arthrobacter sp. GMC3]
MHDTPGVDVLVATGEKMAALTYNYSSLAGFTSADSGIEVSGIKLVQLVDTAMAIPGERLHFTTWILNATSETLTEVTLRLRSFTNELADQLQYTTGPCPPVLTGGILEPGESLSYSFSYEVTQRDIQEPGYLISALQSELSSPSLGRLFSECDALINTAEDTTT